MCCKGGKPKCIGELSCFVVKLEGKVCLMPVRDFWHWPKQGTIVELLSENGRWGKLVSVEITSVKAAVLSLPSAGWPVYLTSNHELDDHQQPTAGDVGGAKPAGKQRVFEFTVAGADHVMVGPYSIKVVRAKAERKQKCERRKPVLAKP